MGSFLSSKSELSQIRSGIQYSVQCTCIRFCTYTKHSVITKINNSTTAKGTAYGKGLMEEMVSRFAFLYYLC